MMVKPLAGILTVIPTAMTEDDELDEAACRRHIRYLLDVGKVHGIIPCGSTGEFAALSEAERKRMIDITTDEVGGQVPVVAGATAISTRDTIRYSQYAERAGADGVLLVHPYYAAPCEREMDEHLRAVASNIGIPIVIYNNPFSTSYDMPATQVARLCQIDNIAYVKETSGNSKRVSDILALCGERMTVLCGDDLLPLETLALGGKGWVSVTANVFPQQCVALYDRVTRDGDLDGARQAWFRLLPFTSLLENSGKFVQYCKAGCELLGRSLGPPRKPFLRPTPDELCALRDAMDRVMA